MRLPPRVPHRPPAERVPAPTGGGRPRISRSSPRSLFVSQMELRPVTYSDCADGPQASEQADAGGSPIEQRLCHTNRHHGDRTVGSTCWPDGFSCCGFDTARPGAHGAGRFAGSTHPEDCPRFSADNSVMERTTLSRFTCLSCRGFRRVAPPRRSQTGAGGRTGTRPEK